MRGGWAALLALAALLAPLAASGQAAGTARVGYLQLLPSANDVRVEAFRARLRELGHVEGKTFTLEYLSAEGKYDRLPALAATLVRRKVDVILTDGGTPSAAAARKAAGTIPIVFMAVGDPVGQGFVASLARPGGNITGTSVQHPEFAPKVLDLLREILPSAKRIAVLSNPANSSLPRVIAEMEVVARRLGLEIRVFNARGPAEFDGTFADIALARPAGLIILRDGLFTSETKRLAGLAVKHKLPMMGGDSSVAESGGLASYGPNTIDMIRRCAGLVDRILKGAKPGELPVEQPTRFDLVINLKTAKELAVTIPQSVLLRADHVIDL